MLSWYIPGIGGTSGDMRVLAQLCKKSLVDRLNEALATHGGKLAALVDPAVALHHLVQQLGLPTPGGTVVLDCGRAQVRMAFLLDGELIFFRCHRPGMDELITGVAELRGLDQDNAEKLLRKLGKNPPEDIKDLIRRHAIGIASAVASNLRFARTQLKMNDIKLDRCLITGRAGRVPGLIEAIAERTQVPATIINPFAGRMSTLPTERMDAYAQLPSTWAAVIGLASAPTVVLDVLDQVRQERVAYWSTTGALRAGVLAAAVLFLLAIGMQFVRMQVSGSAIAQLQGESDDGLVPVAKQAQAELDKAIAVKQDIAGRLRWIDNERLPGRVAVEFLNAIAQLQDPKAMPVYLQGYRLSRPDAVPGSMRIELSGFAEAGTGQRSPHQVIGEFKAALQKAYPLVVGIEDLPQAPGATSQPFKWVITLTQRPAV